MAAHWEILKKHAGRASTIVLAAPYIKAPPLIDILRPARGTIQVISRWSLEDIVSTVTDLACRSIVAESGGRFFLHPRLHAKYYRFDDIILIGSANFTAKGLGYRPDSNLEILCEPSHDFDWSEFEQNLFTKSHEVSDWEFASWQQLVDSEIVSPAGRMPAPAIPMVEWCPRTRDPRHVWLAYSSRLREIASKDQQALAERDLRILAVPPNLPYENFRLWIAGCLLTSRFVLDVSQQPEIVDDHTPLYALATAWNVTLRTAARRRGTVLAWLAYFLD